MSWRHEDIAELLGHITIKTSSGFLEYPSTWKCPGCGRSKAQIICPGRKVNVVAVTVEHHCHTTELIWQIYQELGCRYHGTSWAVEGRSFMKAMEDEFCRFEPTEVCLPCNNVDPAAKALIGAPAWFSFSPREIANFIRSMPYGRRHEIDRYRLDLIWDKIAHSLEDIPSRIRDRLSDYFGR